MKKKISFDAWIYDPFLFIPLRRVRKIVLECLSDYRRAKILDLCCGTGFQLKLLARNGFSDLHCLDLSEDMLSIARKKGYPITTYHVDAAATGFEDRSFDVVILSFALHEKDAFTARKVLEEAHRVLKMKGRLLIVDFMFDDETRLPGRLGITAVERIAGGEHYRNFKNYIAMGGLKNLLNPKDFTELRRCRVLTGGGIIGLYEKV
ncbi:MAG: class I SAM-dependent methyltransferase [Spirochaetales bacterium]|nr:class I SAM-dependent methyltransferase [Spirochaetales bacterium]